MYEPAADSRRVTLRRIDQRPLGNSLTIDGVPSHSGVVALIQTWTVDADERGPVLYADEGFSELWRLWTTRWYGAVLEAEAFSKATGTTSGALTLSQRIYNGKRALLGVDGSAIDDDHSALLFVVTKSGSDESVSVPCGRALRVSVDGWVEQLEMAVDGAPPTVLERNRVVDMELTCAEGKNTVQLRFRGRSLSPNGSVVVVAQTDEVAQ